MFVALIQHMLLRLYEYSSLACSLMLSLFCSYLDSHIDENFIGIDSDVSGIDNLIGDSMICGSYSLSLPTPVIFPES